MINYAKKLKHHAVIKLNKKLNLQLLTKNNKLFVFFKTKKKLQLKLKRTNVRKKMQK